MAQKRMFDRAIIDTDKFMDLPVSAKALYFLLGMEADDEGFVSPRKVLRLHGGTEDDVKILAAKGFVIPFKSGVVVITHWHQNNYLQRKKATMYVSEKSSLTLTSDKLYEFNKGLTVVELVEKSREEKRGEETPSKMVGREDNFQLFWNVYPRKVGRLAALRAWEKTKGVDVAVVIAAVEKQKNSEQWRKDGGRFIPHPATWLNQGRWDDDVAEGGDVLIIK